jgi:hypothetical protein
MRRHRPAHPGRHQPHHIELEAIVSRAGCPEDRAEAYLQFALEFLHTLRRLPVPGFDWGTKLVVMKWFNRGLSGKLLADIGFAIVTAVFPPGPPMPGARRRV